MKWGSQSGEIAMQIGHTIIVACLIGSAVIATAQADEPTKQTALTISVETTRLTEPLDKDGFVDYIRFVDEMSAKGVTTENNFEVVVRQVMGPKEIPEGMRAKYYEMIGIKVPDGPFYEPVDYNLFTDQYEKAHDGPWRPKELPDIALWVAAQNANLDKLVEASKREKSYTPYRAGKPSAEEENYPPLIAMLLPSIQDRREIARGLVIRANMRIGEGNLDAAWQDVKAIFRVSRLSAEGITLVENLVGIAVDSIAVGAAKRVLHSPRLTDEQARRFFNDLQELPMLPSISSIIDTGERYVGLDALQTVARGKNMMETMKLINDLSDGSQIVPSNGASTLVLFQPPSEKAKPNPNAQKIRPINFDVSAKLLNRWYDRLVAAAKVVGYKKRKAMFREIDQDIRQLSKEVTVTKLALKTIGNGPSDALGEMIGNVLVALLLPATGAATDAEHRTVSQRDVLRTAFAAELFRRANDRFPTSIAELKGDYLDEIPVDRFSDQPLQFKVNNGQLVIYSLGQNGRDDGGLGYDDAEQKNPGADWDDLVVRLKRR